MKKLIAVFTAILAFLAVVSPVYATDLPDSNPTVEGINVYRNLRETGDYLMLIYANIPYATPPDDPVTGTFVWRLISTDNVTQLGTTVGYAYNDNGYGYNVYSMYWSANENPTWGTAYTVRLTGNPTAFTTPPIYNFPVSASDYSSLTASADVQAELETRILYLANDLNIKWGLTTAYSLLTDYESQTVLSTYGQTVFRGAIYGVQALAPGVFPYIINDIESTERTWSTAYSDNVSNQWVGTWVETAKEAGAALFGTDYDLLSVIMVLVLCALVVWANIYLHSGFWEGMIDASIVAVFTARLGMQGGLGPIALICALCLIYLGNRLIGVFR